LAAEVTPLWVLMSTVGTERHCFGFRFTAPKARGVMESLGPNASPYAVDRRTQAPTCSA
jgi:hypothetical protein